SLPAPQCTTKIVHLDEIDLVYYCCHTGMRIAMNLTIDGHSPIPIRRQLTEQLKHAIESGGVARDQALPSIRELAGFLGINANTVARVVELAATVRRQRPAGRWRAAVTSFCHLPQVERLLSGRRVPVVALLAEAHLETLHRLAQLPSGTRVGVASAAVETAHNLEHSIANAGLPNIVLVGACPAEGAALGRLVRRVDVIVSSTAAAERVRGLAGPAVQVMIDDRALDPRAIEMLAALLVRQNGDRPTAAPPAGQRRVSPRPSNGRQRRRRVHGLDGAREV